MCLIWFSSGCGLDKVVYGENETNNIYKYIDIFNV